MSFTITGLSVEPFKALFGLPQHDLETRGVIRQIADTKPGYPCRITLDDAAPGETVLLLNHTSHTVATPYASSYAIYLRETAQESAVFQNELPPVMHNRPISLRMFDTTGMLIGADMGRNEDLVAKIHAAFERDHVSYVHAHNAMHGCFAAEIRR